MGSRRAPERFAAVLLWALLAGGLGGCAGPRDPTALIPVSVQTTVMAEDRLREARAAASAQKGDGSAVSVTDILARARAVQDQPAAAQAPSNASASAASGMAGGPPPEAATPEAAAARRALLAATPSPVPSSASSSPPAARQVSAFAADSTGDTTGALPRPSTRAPLIDIVFEPGQDAPGPADAAALAKALKAARLGPGRPVTVLAGPGSAADPFAQALLANKRARAVKALLPPDLPATQLYDPDLEPDTVRILAGSRP
ncbi:MAG TPA: hypothetical protein PLK13_06495 [Xanthobacteraceae bacterium]|jgi:hypothetical protein|nr:MAG: hypothetical protein B7Y61_10965 [Rhizobiales bacterium 35-66-30]OZB03210.1 MAG: hypothetical protein B7X67_17675 [Rhizobiales bacterium 39-66-18]HQS08458.1 hypothetical protein [Xanthobacteraceae bacterium]HQS50075.1 hypothetical protein [Xanthobacteraceae bacterium]